MSDMLEVQQAVSTLDQARAAIPTIEQTIGNKKPAGVSLRPGCPARSTGLLDRARSLPRVPAKVARRHSGRGSPAPARCFVRRRTPFSPPTTGKTAAELELAADRGLQRIVRT